MPTSCTLPRRQGTEVELLADLEALGEDEHGAPRKAVAVSLLPHPRSPEASRGMAER